MATRNVVIDTGSGPDVQATGGHVLVSRYVPGPSGDTYIHATPEKVLITNPPSSIPVEVGVIYRFDPRSPSGVAKTSLIPAGAGDILYKDLAQLAELPIADAALLIDALVDANVVGDDLHVEHYDGTITNAGNVRGVAGGTDAATAEWVETGPLTTAALRAEYATIANRPINLRDLGADPTGVVDAAALLNTNGGRQVDIPTGTYKIGSTAILPAGTTWKCEPGVTFKADFDATGSTAMVKITSASCRIDGGPILDADARVPFVLEVAADKFGSNGLTVTNSKSHGIYIHHANNVAFDHLRALNCGRIYDPLAVGVYASVTNYLTLHDAYAEGSYAQGFYLSGSLAGTVCQLSQIVAVNNGSTGVDLRIPGSNVNGVVATGNLGSGFALNLESTGVNTRDTALNNINCYKNLFVSGSGEISIASADRVIATGLKAYSDAMGYGLRINATTRLLIAGALIQGDHAGYVGALKVPAHGVGCANIDIYASSFETPAGVGTVFEIAGIVDGFRVASSTIRGGNYGVTYIGPNAISNTDFRLANNWGTITLANRFRELSAPTGTGRLPVAAPAVATGTDATMLNTIRTDLINTGFYK